MCDWDSGSQKCFYLQNFLVSFQNRNEGSGMPWDLVAAICEVFGIWLPPSVRFGKFKT